MKPAIGRQRIAGVRQEHVDPWLLFAMLSLLAIGIVFVTSASLSIAESEYGLPFYYTRKQALFTIAGLLAAVFAWITPLRFWQASRGVLLLAAFGLLMMVLVPGIGYEVNGSIRWIRFGPVGVQASEPARLFIYIYLAAYMVKRQEEVLTSFGGFIRPLLLVFSASLLLLAEPDFGAALVLLATALAMFFIGGVRLRDFTVLLSVAMLAFIGLAMSSSYRLQRLTGFLDPWADPFNSGFQLTQSLIAIGRGEWVGVGLGASVQKLFYLPEAHTDFVFAVIAEETGLFGSLVVIGLYLLLVSRIFAIAATAARREQMFGAYLSWGIGTWIGLQAFINLGVNMGVLPTKGLTLPFVSAGGSSLLVCCFAIGLVMRVARECQESDRNLWLRKEVMA